MSQNDINDIIEQHLKNSGFDTKKIAKFSIQWKINKGDVDIKYPMDYSPHVGPHVEEVKITLES